MVLTHTATIYVAQAISKTNPSDIPSCEDAGDELKRSASRQHGFRKMAKDMLGKLGETIPTKVSGAASVAYQAADPDTKYYRSIAAIYSGPVTISSRKYNIPYSQGYMEFVEWSQRAAPPLPAAEVAGLHLVEPNTFKVRVQRPPRPGWGHY
jgi:hypothetical protein